MVPKEGCCGWIFFCLGGVFEIVFQGNVALHGAIQYILQLIMRFNIIMDAYFMKNNKNGKGDMEKE